MARGQRAGYRIRHCTALIIPPKRRRVLRTQSRPVAAQSRYFLPPLEGWFHDTMSAPGVFVAPSPTSSVTSQGHALDAQHPSSSLRCNDCRQPGSIRLVPRSFPGAEARRRNSPRRTGRRAIGSPSRSQRTTGSRHELLLGLTHDVAALIERTALVEPLFVVPMRQQRRAHPSAARRKEVRHWILGAACRPLHPAVLPARRGSYNVREQTCFAVGLHFDVAPIVATALRRSRQNGWLAPADSKTGSPQGAIYVPGDWGCRSRPNAGTTGHHITWVLTTSCPIVTAPPVEDTRAMIRAHAGVRVGFAGESPPEMSRLLVLPWV